MFYCVLHNWYSSEERCPACFPKITVTTATSASGTSDEASHQPKEDKPERDWEILQLKGRHGRQFIYNKKDGMWINEYECGFGCSDEDPKNTGCDIYSVKRISDGLVFSVGDEVTLGTINSFEALSNGEMIVRMNGLDGFANIKFIHKKSKPKEELKEPERITVEEISAQDIYGLVTNGTAKYSNYMMLKFNGSISSTQIPLIKQAIEQVLNADKIYYTLHPHTYTEEYVNKMMEEAATAFVHYTEFVMDADDWLKNGEMKSMYEVYNDFTQWKNSKKSSLK